MQYCSVKYPIFLSLEQLQMVDYLNHAAVSGEMSPPPHPTIYSIIYAHDLHYSHVTWVAYNLRSLATQLFVQRLVQVNKKAPH